jgi:hypothetical protein
VRLLDPIIAALRALEADGVFVSGVYRWFRWLHYHAAYGVTSPEEEEHQSESQQSRNIQCEQTPVAQDHDGIELLSSTAESITFVGPEPTSSETAICHTDESRRLDADTYQPVEALPLSELQTIFRDKIKTRWSYVHTNAMGIVFLLDPSMNLDAFVGSDDDGVDDQVCEMAQRCGILTPASGISKLTAEILAFKSAKRRGGEALRQKYSESSPRDYWNAKSEKKFPLLKKIAKFLFAIPISSAASESAWGIFDHIHLKKRNRLSVENVEMLAYVYINHGTIDGDVIDLARHQSCPESVEAED